MSVWVDLKDWLGGYPFEVASPEDVVASVTKRGYGVKRSTDVGRKHGCNEFVFEKN
jgi:2-polyprenyl-6-hydroxyphenyl methylase/3-demethylubiquinone-9 3-methyltransferase